MQWRARRLCLVLVVGCCRLACADDLFVVEWSDSSALVSRLDLASSNRTFVGATGLARVNAMARSGSGAFYVVDGGGDLLVIDPATGAGTVVAAVDLGGVAVDVPGLAFSPDGTLYAINNGNPDDLYAIDVQTGTGSLVGATGVGDIQGLACDGGGRLYGWGIGAGLYTVDRSTGAATDVNPSVGAVEDIQSLAFGVDGTLYGAHRDVFTIDRETGTPALYADIPVSLGVRGMEFDTGPVTRLALARAGVLCWQSVTNLEYQLQRAANGADLLDGRFTNVGPTFPGTGGEICVTNAATPRYGVFRLVTRTAP